MVSNSEMDKLVREEFEEIQEKINSHDPEDTGFAINITYNTSLDIFDLKPLENITKLVVRSRGETPVNISTNQFEILDEIERITFEGDFSFDKYFLDGLENLKKIEIHGTTELIDENPKISKIPNLCSSNIKTLEMLEISQTLVEQLPDDFFNPIQYIQLLILNRNKLRNVPKSLDELIENDQVEVLDLSYNLLDSIPDFYFESKHLQSILLRENPLHLIPRTLYQRISNLSDNEKPKEFFISFRSPNLPDYLDVYGDIHDKEIQESLLKYYNETGN